MRFGIREICDVVFKAKSTVTIGSKTFKKGQPVLYIDSAKTSTIEGAATTVYATGGRGNTRLISWEGEKTLTFTVEDALLSPIGLSVLSGAGLLKGAETESVHVHTSCQAYVDGTTINLKDALDGDEEICTEAPLFIVPADEDGSLNGGSVLAVTAVNGTTITLTESYTGNIFCDFYVLKKGSTVSEVQIDAANFAGYYYVEASTLFRRQNDGKDLPAEITFPNVKIQSNFTFTMASTGDPSTFTFTMDAMPGYTYFNPNKKVLCVMQIIEDDIKKTTSFESVMKEDANKHEDDIESSYKPTSTPVTTLGAPASVTYNASTRTLAWDKVANAYGYEIEIPNAEYEVGKDITKYVFTATEAADLTADKITVQAVRGNMRGTAKTATVSNA